MYSLTASRSTLCTIFDGVFCKIQELVDSQISAVKERGIPVKVRNPGASHSSLVSQEAKAILLVGGFGESKYLFDRLSAANKAERIAVLQESRG